MFLTNIVSFDGLDLGPFSIKEMAVQNLFGTKIDIYWSTVFLIAGILAAFVFAVLRAKKAGFRQEDVFDVSLISIIFGLIVSRLFYALFNMSDFDSFFDVFSPAKNGGSLLAAIFAGMLSAVVFCRIKKINKYAYFDIAVVALLIGQTVGRIGDFFTADAAGVFDGQIPWGMTVNAKGPFHPVFLYEVLFTAVILIFILIFNRKLKKHDGEPFALYLLLYGAGRFVIELLRNPVIELLTVNISLALSLVMAVWGLVLFILIKTGFADKMAESSKEKESAKELPYDSVYKNMLGDLPSTYVASRDEIENSLTNVRPEYLASSENDKTEKLNSSEDKKEK